MNEILKRLEIIKSSISIEDEEIIELQVIKLQKMDIDDDAKKILAFLKKSEYSDALTYIEEYLKRYSGVTLYIDPEVQGLKLELKSLESKLQKLVEKKTEALNSIEEFNREYTLRIGSLIEEILALKKEILYKKTIAKVKLKEQYQQDKATYEETQSTIDEIKKSIEELEEVLEEFNEESAEYEEYTKLYDDLKDSLHDLEEEQELQEEQLKGIEDELDDESIKEEYEEAKNSYEEYHQEYEEIIEEHKNIATLGEKEKKELKKIYKKAARLCHPDIVIDELKAQAHKIMQALNSAYSKQDLAEVKMILLSLENGTGFEVSSDAINDTKILKAKIDEIKSKLHKVEAEVEDIQKDETFATLSELDNWDTYFDELKEELQEQKEKLEEEARKILEGKKEEEKRPRQGIKKENSQYSKDIQDIQNPNFEKIRRYCNNLVKNNQADEMQADLANNGKMHKALVYNALEQFIEQLQPNTIDIVDWGAGQGNYSMLIVDYIREKQLDINVGNVILIDNDATVLSRAIAQVNVLAQEDTNVSSLTMNKAKSIKDFKLGNIPLHIFVNDAIDMDLPKKAFKKEAYYMCLSNDNENFVQKIHTKISSFMNGGEIITNRKAKVGQFQKFEIIFKSPEISFFDIDEDEIPF